MSTLHELVRYCNEENHMGALLLIGEWGCGKTYLIEKQLAEELAATHFIVRVSLVGVENFDALNDAIRKRWLSVCTPFLGKMKEGREELAKRSSFLNTISSILKALNPVTGSVATAIVTADPLEYIPLEPVVEDFHDKGVMKKVVLVFDDLNVSKLDMEKLVGTINEYCENLGFKTIVIINEAIMRASAKVDTTAYRQLKEKTISRTLLFLPDYPAIVHEILTRNAWINPEYAAFLVENEPLILDVFASDCGSPNEPLGKCHNIRSLIFALQEFHRIYELLTNNGVKQLKPYLYLFLTEILVLKNGIIRNGQTCYDVYPEEIRQLYPEYDPDRMPESVVRWIEYGIWDEDVILRDLLGSVEPEESAPEEQN